MKAHQDVRIRTPTSFFPLSSSPAVDDSVTSVVRRRRKRLGLYTLKGWFMEI